MCSTTAENQKKDQLWDQVFDTLYESYFQELFSDYLVSRWRMIDDIAKVLIAITATGSAVSAWPLWAAPEGRVIWTIIAGFTSLTAIIHASLGVPAKLSQWVEIKQHFISLRIDLETLQHNMAIDPDFNLDEKVMLYNEMRKRYRDGMMRLQNDWFRSYKRAVLIQENKVNPRLVSTDEE